MKNIYLLTTAIWLVPNTINLKEKINNTNRAQTTTAKTAKEILDVYHISAKDFNIPEKNDTIIGNQNIEILFNKEEYINKIKNTILWWTTIELENMLNELSKDDLKQLQQYVLWYKDDVNKSEYPIWSTIRSTENWWILWWGALSLQIKNVIDRENWRQQSWLDRESGQPFFFIKSLENWIEIILRSNRVIYHPKMEDSQYFYEKEELIIDYPVIIITYQWNNVYFQNVYFQKATDFSDASYSTRIETKKSKSEWEKNNIINQSIEKEHQAIYDKHLKTIQEYDLSKKNEKTFIEKLDELSYKYKKNNETFLKEAEKNTNTAANHKKIEDWENSYKKYNSINFKFNEEELEAIKYIETNWLLMYLKQNIEENEKKAISIYTKIFNYINIKSTNKTPLLTPYDLWTKQWREKNLDKLYEDIKNIKLASSNWTIKESWEDIEKCIAKIEKIRKIIYSISYQKKDIENGIIKNFFKDNF